MSESNNSSGGCGCVALILLVLVVVLLFRVDALTKRVESLAEQTGKQEQKATDKDK